MLLQDRAQGWHSLTITLGEAVISMNAYQGCGCRNCQVGQGACLKTTAGAPYWVVRLASGRETGPFATHADALDAARRSGGGTPVEREA